MNELFFSEDLSGDFFSKCAADIPFADQEVVVKLHMGEPKNPNHLKPAEVKPFVDLLLARGCRPFLFDTTVNYGGRKADAAGHAEVAAENGFLEENLGCPVVVGDGENVKIKGSIVFEVAEFLSGRPVLVLTHVKGHMLTGIGASIKNIGVGGVTKRTKGEMHSSSNFIRLVVEGAEAVLSKCGGVYCVNFLKRMAGGCDCENRPMEPVVDDIGILAGQDILSIDKASYRLIKEKAGTDIFEELHGVSFQQQLNYAADMELGSEQYEILSV